MVGTVYGSRIVADVTLKSLSPYSQSRAHDEPAYENESKADYDRRTWRSHLHVENGTVRIPAKALHDCWIEAAEYSGKKSQAIAHGRSRSRAALRSSRTPIS